MAVNTSAKARAASSCEGSKAIDGCICSKEISFPSLRRRLSNAELAGEIILPLKLQGVADIADSALVCRLKFTAKPNRASWVQREALKRVYAAFDAEGLHFASGAVTVKSSDPDRPASPLAAVAQLTPTPTEAAD